MPTHSIVNLIYAVIFIVANNNIHESELRKRREEEKKHAHMNCVSS